MLWHQLCPGNKTMNGTVFVFSDSSQTQAESHVNYFCACHVMLTLPGEVPQLWQTQWLASSRKGFEAAVCVCEFHIHASKAAVYWISPPCDCFEYGKLPGGRPNSRTGLSCSLTVFTEVTSGLVFLQCSLHVQCERGLGLQYRFSRSYSEAYFVSDRSGFYSPWSGHELISSWQRVRCVSMPVSQTLTVSRGSSLNTFQCDG